MQLRGETIDTFSWKKKNKLDGNIVNVKKNTKNCYYEIELKLHKQKV